MNVQEAIEVLKQALQKDPGYALSWQANIAMAVVDEAASGPYQDIRQLANAGARRFLTSHFGADLGVIAFPPSDSVEYKHARTRAEETKS